MAGSNDDGGEWWIFLLLVGAAVWWFFLRDGKTESPTVEPPALTMPPPVFRPPTGMMFATSLEDGTVWSVDADSLRGPRTARMAWVFADHSKDKTVSARETRTLYEINCDRGSYITRAVLDYDAKGNVGAKATDPQLSDDPDFAPPQTNIATVLGRACDPVFDTPAK